MSIKVNQGGKWVHEMSMLTETFHIYTKSLSTINTSSISTINAYLFRLKMDLVKRIFIFNLLGGGISLAFNIDKGRR